MSSEAQNLEPGTVLRDTYKIVRQIGSGGMGEVYEATHMRLAGRYAIKKLHPMLSSHAEALARFRREAEVTSALRHPNVVQVLDFDSAPDGSPFMVMEFLEGVDLATRISGGPLSLPDAVALTKQVASVLSAAHANGVVHRDLKPQNVFIVPFDGKDLVKVLDFGISKVKAATGGLTLTSKLLGTPYYMSPEQAQGQEVDELTDQFALATIVFEMLTGRRAFTGDDMLAILYQVVHEPIPALVPEQTPAVRSVIERALAKQKTARFATITEFSRELERAAQVALTPEPVADREPPPDIRSMQGSLGGDQAGRAPRRVQIAIAGGVVLLALVGALAIGRRSDGERPAAAPPPADRTRLVTAAPVFEPAKPPIPAPSPQPKPDTKPVATATLASRATPRAPRPSAVAAKTKTRRGDPTRKEPRPLSSETETPPPHRAVPSTAPPAAGPTSVSKPRKLIRGKDL